MKRYISLVDFVTLFLTAFNIIVYIFIYNGSYTNEELITFLSILGWIEFVFCVITMKIKCGKFFTLYSIFLIFSFLFTYGQCLMWALNIHLENEIGKQRLYTLGTTNNDAIVHTQMLTLIGLLVFHCGSLISYRKKPANNKFVEIENDPQDQKKNALLGASWICNIVSSPFMLYSILRSVAINSIYGYGAVLNNAAVVATQNNFVLLIRMMYIPSLFGILISSEYKKGYVRYCYISFALYMILSMLAGDRGEWLFPLLLIVWMHHNYYKPIMAKRMLGYIIAGFLLASISVGIRDSRNTGVTVSGFLDALSGSQNPIISAIFEMGGSMRPTLVLVQYGWNSYPYGNSYLLALIGMITEKPLSTLIPGYESLSGWFSRSYLGIKYGAGFSFIAEAFANYGPYLFLVAMFLMGILFSKGMFFAEGINYKKRPLASFMGLATANAMILAIRNTLLVSLKTWIYSTLTILIVYYLICSITRHNRSTRI